MTRHTLIRQTERAWWLTPDGTTDRPVLGALAGARGTLIVDAGASPAHAAEFQAALAAAGLPAPAWVALTHWHWDHVFGAAAFQAPLIAQAGTARMLETMRGWSWDDAALDQRVAAGVEIAFCRDMIKAELPDRGGLRLRGADLSFGDRVTIDLGGARCQLIHVGGDHAADSIIIHLPDEGVAFLGDALYQDIYREPRRYTLGRLRPLLERTLALGAEWHLWGHGPEPMGRAELRKLADELIEIGELVTGLGGDRAASVAELERRRGRPLNEDEQEDLAAFCHGLAPADPGAPPAPQP